MTEGNAKPAPVRMVKSPADDATRREVGEVLEALRCIVELAKVAGDQLDDDVAKEAIVTLGKVAYRRLDVAINGGADGCFSEEFLALAGERTSRS